MITLGLKGNSTLTKCMIMHGLEIETKFMFSMIMHLLERNDGLLLCIIFVVWRATVNLYCTVGLYVYGNWNTELPYCHNLQIKGLSTVQWFSFTQN
jgi:hypothetical protein